MQDGPLQDRFPDAKYISARESKKVLEEARKECGVTEEGSNLAPAKPRHLKLYTYRFDIFSSLRIALLVAPWVLIFLFAVSL